MSKRKTKITDTVKHLTAEVDGISYVLIPYNEVDADGDMFLPGSVRMPVHGVILKGPYSEQTVIEKHSLQYGKQKSQNHTKR